MYDNSQARKRERFSAQQLADKVAFDERCMLNWHCCGGKKRRKKAKQNNKKKKKQSTKKKFHPLWNSNATTSEVWHRNILADMKYLTRLQPAAAGGSTRRCWQTAVDLGLVSCTLICSQWLYLHDSGSENNPAVCKSAGNILTNRGGKKKQSAGFKPNIHRRRWWALGGGSDRRTADEVMLLWIKHEVESILAVCPV